MTDPAQRPLDAMTIAAGVRAGAFTATAVVEAAIARAERIEPIVHAFSVPAFTEARAAAAALDRRRSAGADLGPLAGVPVAIKDTVFTKGIRTTSGSHAYRDFVPEEDDVVVERLKAAGAIVLGKTNVPEFAYAGVGHNPVFPTTCNPWNPARTSGGSSAGSAVAVATGVTPIAIGSDAGGSIRIPAAFCGIVGVKPSWGRVPLYPGCRDERYPGASSFEHLEHLGPLTRTLADAALALSVIAGPDPRDRHSIPSADVDWLGCARPRDLAGARIAFSADLGYAIVEPEVRDIALAAARTFADRLGARLEEASPGLPDVQPPFLALVALDSDLTGMRRIAAALGAKLSPHLIDFLGRRWTAEDLTDAVTFQKTIANKLARFMADYELLLTPTTAVPPFGLGIRGPDTIAGRAVPPTKWTALTSPFNMTGQPAVSVPAGWTADGLPVGLQIVGRHLDDTGVLRAAAAYEQARPWHDRWPPLAHAH